MDVTAQRRDSSPVEYEVARDFRLYWSNLKNYEECPQKFLWGRGWADLDVGGGLGRKKPKPVKKSEHHAVMGIVIQSVVETFYNDELWRHPEGLQKRLTKMVEVVLAQQIAKKYIDWRWAESEAEMFDICTSGVIGYLRTMKHHKFLGPFARSEVHVPGSIDKWNPVGGYLDMIIRRDDTGVTILDGKNAKTKNQYVDPDQLRFYALCFYLAYHKMPDRLAFVWYRYPYDGAEETGIEWVPFTKEDLQRLARRAKDTRTLMNKHKFEATPSSKACKWCDYETVCPERQQMREDNPRSKKQISLPIVDDATGFVEFGLNSPVHVESKSGSKP